MISELVLTFGGFLRLCQFWWKSIKKCDRESAHRRIHWQTDWRTQTDFRPIICPMLYAIAMVQIIECCDGSVNFVTALRDITSWPRHAALTCAQCLARGYSEVRRPAVERRVSPRPRSVDRPSDSWCAPAARRLSHTPSPGSTTSWPV